MSRLRIGLKRLATVLPERPRRALARFALGLEGRTPPTYGYRVVKGAAPPELVAGWQTPQLADRQEETFAPLLDALRAGRPREDFVSLVDAVRATGLPQPSILEVGAGSGLNLEALHHGLERPPTYTGSDYSLPMVEKGARIRPHARWLAADGGRIPFRDQSFDITLSGGSLIHIPHWRDSVRECARVARRAVVFSVVTVREKGPTTTLRKMAYGAPVVELVFHERELLATFEESGLRLRKAYDNFDYDLAEYVGERTRCRTYACDVTG